MRRSIAFPARRPSSCGPSTGRKGAELARRRLDLELLHRKLVPSRAAAQRAIAAGNVVVTGVPEPKAATLVDSASDVRVVAASREFVSRAGTKLAAALRAFGVDPTNKRAIDVGASTGGFSDCLLQAGASSVVAVDVGYGQLAWSLRQDDRMAVFERTNIRTADPAVLGAPFDVVVADLSFIGLRLVADQLVSLGAAHTDWVLLVKPQFEAGREAVSRGGVVDDPALRARAVVDVATAFWDRGVGTAGCLESPTPGARSGNLEYLLWLRRDADRPRPADLRRIVAGHG